MSNLTSVICLCYQHERFVRIALESVYAQSTFDWELIIVDDASTDKSVEEINKFLKEKQKLNPPQHIVFLNNKINLGNCKSFNLALSHSKGKYVIDLSADDILLPNRIKSQVNIFETLPSNYGVIFSNAMLIKENGKKIAPHFPVDFEDKTIENVPNGDVYAHILRKYFVCTPTMMMRMSVLQELGGYDEDLSYEDFDFWVRSARNYHYHYQDEITTQKRKTLNSLSSKFYKKKNNAHLESTLKVCKKSLIQNKTQLENEALSQTVAYHFRQSFFMQHYVLAKEYLVFWKLIPNVKVPLWAKFIGFLAKYRVPTFGLYAVYRWFKS